MATEALEVRGIDAYYGDSHVLHAVSFALQGGRLLGLLGRNGAGKSSILKALLGLVRPAQGTLRILDLPQDAPPDRIRARVGYMPERDSHLPGLSGFEMVALLGRLSGVPARDSWRRAHEVLYLVGLEEQRYRPIGGYSAGMRQKAKLATALVHDPQVLFLDEPTNGLDPDGRVEMLHLVNRLARELGKSVVLSTHILQDVEQVCDAVVVLEQGRVVAQGPLGELLASDTQTLRLQVEPVDVALQERAPAGMELVPQGPGRFHVQLGASASVRDLFELVKSCGGEVRMLQQHRRSLEEVFLGAVGEASR